MVCSRSKENWRTIPF